MHLNGTMGGYQAIKSVVIVFNESESDFKKDKRNWFFGPDMVEETSEYKHLGIMLNKYLSLNVSIDESCSKLKSTFLSLVNSGINETGFHPITSFHLYKCCTERIVRC